MTKQFYVRFCSQGFPRLYKVAYGYWLDNLFIERKGKYGKDKDNYYDSWGEALREANRRNRTSR